MADPGLSLSGVEAALFRSACGKILAANEALYLTATIAGDTGFPLTPLPQVRVCLFDGFWKQAVSHSCALEPELAVVSAIMRPMLIALAKSWPPHWVPAQLGIMTDGSGIVFSPELPNPEEEHWSLRLLSRDVSIVELLPFIAGSPWSMLNGATADSHH